MTVCSGVVNRWWYQPGEVIPAPYPEAAASREYVHGTQVSVIFRFGIPRSSAASAAAGGSFPDRAGACQAPHTTATVPAVSFSAARRTWRMCASRRCSRSCSPGVPARSSAMASVSAANGDPPSSRDSITLSHQRSGSSKPAAAASCAIGSPSGSASASPSQASIVEAGRSQNRAGTWCAAAQASACHSGENTA